MKGIALARGKLMIILLLHRYHVKISVRGLSQMGKSSFVRRQQQRHHDTPLPSVASSEEILHLARKTNGRTRGSKSYLKAWRHWMGIAVEAIRQDLSLNLPHPVEAAELAQLSFNLGVAADKGQMPSFSSPGARSGYALDYFCRARLLAGLFVNMDSPTVPTFSTKDDSRQQYCGETNNAISLLTGNGQTSSSKAHNATVHLTSLGGGPGFDFVAAALAVIFSSGGNTENLPALRTTVLDYEEGWESLVDSMNDSTLKILQQPTWRCDWGGKCDITKPLNHADNAACRTAIKTTHVWTCQYCVAENASKLRASNYIFFRDLWNAIPEGSIFIITETTPRLWPEFYRIIEEHCPLMEVSFPNQKGPQLLLRKSSRIIQGMDDVQSSIRVDECLKSFEEIAARHEERLASGWERQSKKRHDHDRTSTSKIPTLR
jgi:hypothetical protein